MEGVPAPDPSHLSAAHTYREGKHPYLLEDAEAGERPGDVQLDELQAGLPVCCREPSIYGETSGGSQALQPQQHDTDLVLQGSPVQSLLRLSGGQGVKHHGHPQWGNEEARDVHPRTLGTSHRSITWS